MKNLVSIIINNYNYDRFLAEAIDSALNQTYNNIEVIVVDDASTDNSFQVISSYGEKIEPVLRSENGKQAAALNDGFAVSKGEIIIFLDADDFLFEEAVENIITVWKKDTVKLHYRLEVVDSLRQPLGYFYPSIGLPLTEEETFQELIDKGGYISVPMSGNAYSRDTLTKVFPIPEQYKLSADDYLMISIPFYGKVSKIDEPMGAYRIHNSNQWALTEVSDSRFRRFVRHDLQNYALLSQKAGEFGIKISDDLENRSIGRVWSRLASFRLNKKEHPLPKDNSLLLTRLAMRSLWKYTDHNSGKKVVFSFWVICVAFMPLPVARLAITWLYAPHLRPKKINVLLNQIRTSLS